MRDDDIVLCWDLENDIFVEMYRIDMNEHDNYVIVMKKKKRPDK